MPMHEDVEVIEKDVEGASKSAGGDADPNEAVLEKILQGEEAQVTPQDSMAAIPLKSIMSEKRNSPMNRTHDSIKPSNRQV